MILLALAACVIENDFPAQRSRPPEHCNAVDDDGDGAVDEGFPDGDGNGRPDCLDLDCWSLPEASEGPTAFEPCLRPSVPDPGAVEPVWAYDGPDAPWPINASYGNIAVAHLDDDDGDGVVGAGDRPEIVLTAFGYGTVTEPEGAWLIVLDGQTGAERWAVPILAAPTCGVAVADVDADGAPEIVGVDDAQVTAWSADGAVEWVNDDELQRYTDESRFYVRVCTPTVADLEGDGIPEVLVDDRVLDGPDGATRVVLEEAYAGTAWHAPLAGDVDRDGDQEILLSGAVYDSDGSLLWRTKTPGGLPHAALVQADGDEDAEIVLIGTYYELYDPDGTLLASEPTPDVTHTSGPCAADFDGDGDQDIAWANQETLGAYTLQGDVLWEVPIDNRGPTTIPPPCGAIDANGDGAADVAYAGLDGTALFDGPTGARISLAESLNAADGPAFADLDGDGSPELIGAEHLNDGLAGLLHVYTHAGGAWPDAPSVRPMAHWDTFNVAVDGSVPARPEAPWLVNGGVRVIPPPAPPIAANLRPTVLGACVADPDWGPVAVNVQVENPGGADAPAGVDLVLYAIEADSSTREVGRQTLPAVPARSVAATVRFDLRPGDVGALGWRVVVDPEAHAAECLETDNSDEAMHP